MTGERQGWGPAVVAPRLDVKPWGGRRLETLGLKLPPDVQVGEALLTANEATIGAGRTLGELVAADPTRLGARGRTAAGGRSLFPLQVKLIDATENLSIQVHPDDAAAGPLDRLGKTEAWHVLAADPGALLYLGLQPGIPFERFADACRRRDGSAATLLRAIPARAGMTVLIPAGTVHALGAGVMVYEVQQPSDVTYRLDDWGRRDAQGRPREMHIDEGLAVACTTLMPEPIAPVAVRATAGRRHILAACRYFALERIALAAGERAPLIAVESPRVVTVLTGEGSVRSAGATAALAPGQSAVIWPASVPLWLEASRPLVALSAWVPDIATEIVALARISGAAEHEITALGGPLDDVRAAP
ncbi:MAG: class I mannose-6-phosphate isomerase [Chloroflexia bacterium]|nr:class I mannose-6-phosphate isomerase [Chloroflexia bacterium]